MKNSIKAFSAALLTMGTLVVPAISQAASSDPVHQKVRFADLDLNTLDGNAALYRRLTSAAAGVCQSENDYLPGAATRHCQKTALDQAVNSINSPMLTLINGGYEPTFVIVAAPRPVVTVVEMVGR